MSNSGSGNGKKKSKGPAFEVYQKPDAESQVYITGAGDKKKRPAESDSTSSSKGGGPQGKAKQTSGKQKFQSLDLEKLREGLLPGRHACICLASKHKLLGNCLRCGRIICEQEGPGPCMTCGNEVFDKKQQGRIAQKIHEHLVSEGLDQIPAAEIQKFFQQEEEQRKAEEYKNMLLDFDRTSARRTKVIDDETDYYSSETNAWLSSKEKEKLKAKEAEIQKAREEREKERRVTIDIAGRKILETSNTDEKEAKLREMYQDEVEGLRPDLSQESTGYFANHDLHLPVTPKFVPPKGKSTTFNPSDRSGKSGRVLHDFETGSIDLPTEGDDKEDQGLCLSMWQPWASLLVYGLKRVEGRSWPTSHRGRLWIAAAAKKPSPEEMKLVIDQHLAQSPPNSKVPKIYPTSCLLGCVDIVDCLSQAEYQAQCDEASRQSESEFVFLCTNPRILETPIPVSGQHKIWNLDPEVLQQCQNQVAKR